MPEEKASQLQRLMDCKHNWIRIYSDFSMIHMGKRVVTTVSWCAECGCLRRQNEYHKTKYTNPSSRRL